MNTQTFVRVATCIFTIVGVVHLYRAFNGWPILINTWAVPTELSWAAGIVALALAYAGYRHWK